MCISVLYQSMSSKYKFITLHMKLLLSYILILSYLVGYELIVSYTSIDAKREQILASYIVR